MSFTSPTKPPCEEAPPITSILNSSDGTEGMESRGQSYLGDAQEPNAEEWLTSRQKQPRTIRTSSTKEELAMSLQKQSESKLRDEDEDMSASELEDIVEAANAPQTAMDRRAQQRKMTRFR